MLPTHLPTPDLFLPETGEPALRWGIIGPGWIAGMFADALHAHTAQRVVAVGSRSQDRADVFAAQHGIEHALGSVEALVSHPQVDVVYIAAPQSEHEALGLQAIAAGKHVLIEKPFTVTAAEARTLTEAGRSAGVLVMEAMWSRYLPQASVLRGLLADGVLGEVRSVLADHGQLIPTDPAHRLNRPDMAGGALLDLGVYPMQFAFQALGAPESIHALGALTGSGVDAYATVVLQHGGLGQSVVTTSMVARSHTSASIAGTDAAITFAGPFYNPTSFRLASAEHGGPMIDWSDPTPLRGFDALSWEATALARFVGEGRLESPVHDHEETIGIIGALQEARAQLGAVGAVRDEVAA
ncbi:Gfo/Idh/MocA family oxidoreductase [Rathayibacter sp. VKM Ac-2929]|uniref:Gfo/Idh/MocA family protein n=1 Tax=Rathayibacter sp. VKM Ac-2929 TaxID=2929480 RepID=UPI001FB47AE5|nr:Gfo/Idh/MocA family oxidoreductase [Rathayibacter sp. VKM Ac-2929]MCJ1675548.1 Gfo/Idh/MocA family oxidoreductase [Rathayibacter sp. VKM Ac-2929]